MVPKSFVHMTTVVGPGCRISSGTRVWHYKHLSAALAGRGGQRAQDVFAPDTNMMDCLPESLPNHNASRREGLRPHPRAFAEVRSRSHNLDHEYLLLNRAVRL